MLVLYGGFYYLYTIIKKLKVMKILKPYYIFNLLDNELVINTASSELYIQRVQLIAKENEQDKEFVLETVEQCDAYILDECENLGFDKL